MKIFTKSNSIRFISLTKTLQIAPMQTPHRLTTSNQIISNMDFIPTLREKALTIYPLLLEAVRRMIMLVVQSRQPLQQMAAVLEFLTTMGVMYTKQIALSDLLSRLDL